MPGDRSSYRHQRERAMGSKRQQSGDLKALVKENEELRAKHSSAVHYIREKVNQLLTVMGTSPLKPEELDDATLIDLDPIGIVSTSFGQILRHLSETNDKLRLAGEEIQAIFDSAGIGILVVDKEMRVLAYNKQLQKQFFRDKPDMTGKPCYTAICNLQYPSTQCPFIKVFRKGESFRHPGWILRGRHYDIVANPVRDQSRKISRVVLVYKDITDHIRSEEAIASEKERLAVTLRSIGDGVITTDTRGNVVLINKVAELLTGWPQEEAAGRHITEVFHIIGEKTRKRCDDPVARVLKSGYAAELANNTILVSRDGAERTVADSAAPIMDRNSSIIGTVLVFRDVTEKRKLEKELVRAEKLESLGIIAGGIAHDFNNLLNGIIGNIDLALAFTDPEHEAYGRLSQAEKASLRARDLTCQLLTFAQGGAPVRKISSLRDLIREAAGFALTGSNVTCAFDLPETLWNTEIDEGQISQVINNLVINAVQAMPGGGSIRIRAENVSVTPQESPHLKQGDYLKIGIKDTGAGIPGEHLQRIFEPYFTTKQKGTGLGLATVYSIIRNHDGYIDVDSAVGSGTTFYIYLPASPGAPEPETASEAVIAHDPVRRRILVMDDEDIVRETISAMLNKMGCDVGLAVEGREAVRLYREARESGRPFDAVIFDLTVPGEMGGREALKELLSFDPAIRAIVSSGYSSDPIMANYRQYGFSGVIAKPYKMKDLQKALADVLRDRPGNTV